jgi:hypothetical protein
MVNSSLLEAAPVVDVDVYNAADLSRCRLTAAMSHTNAKLAWDTTWATQTVRRHIDA